MVLTTPLKHDSIKIMLLGSDELGHEVVAVESFFKKFIYQGIWQTKQPSRM
jgi:hypothetical protein